MLLNVHQWARRVPWRSARASGIADHRIAVARRATIRGVVLHNAVTRDPTNVGSLVADDRPATPVR